MLTRGTNTGDETEESIKEKLSITTLSGENTGDQDLTPFVRTDAGKAYNVLACVKLFVESAAAPPPSPSAWIKINGAKKAINVAFIKKE